jgi:hypothetical protein
LQINKSFSVLIPLQDPAPIPNPEQTASWFSSLLYFYLDPIIMKASKTPHLPASELPPLADYDWAKNLIKKSFPVGSFFTSYTLQMFIHCSILIPCLL